MIASTLRRCAMTTETPMSLVQQVASRSFASTPSIARQQQQQQQSEPSAFDAASFKLNQSPEEIKALVQKLKQNPNYFANISHDAYEFKAVPNPANGGYNPGLFRKNEVKSGLKHISPIARVTLAAVDAKGNTGKQKYGTKEVISDPKEAEYEIIINGSPLLTGEAGNAEFAAYSEWLRVIREKFIQHLVANLDSYTTVKKRLRSQAQDKWGFLIDSNIPPLSRQPEPVEGKEGSEYVAFKSKVFYNNKDANVKDSSFVVPGDKELFTERGLRRINLSVFDVHGKSIPYDQRGIKYGDVVSLEANLLPIVFDSTSIGSVRRMVNSVLYVQREGKTSSSTANNMFFN